MVRLLICYTFFYFFLHDITYHIYYLRRLLNINVNQIIVQNLAWVRDYKNHAHGTSVNGSMQCCENHSLSEERCR